METPGPTASTGVTVVCNIQCHVTLIIFCSQITDSCGYCYFHYYTTTLHTFNGPFSGTTQVSRYQKGKTNLDFTEARDSEWHQLGHASLHLAPDRQPRQHPTTQFFCKPDALPATEPTASKHRGKSNLDFTEARDSGWQWHQLGYMQVCTSLQTDDHTSTPPLLCFLQAGCPSCRPTNSIKALKAL